MLAQAVVGGHLGVVKQLLAAGATLCDWQSRASGFSLVHLAVCSGQHTRVLPYLLRVAGADAGLRGAGNVSPLEIAVFWGVHEAVALLVSEAGGRAGVDHADPHTGSTLAMMALLNGDFDILQLLVDAGASMCVLVRECSAVQCSAVRVCV